MTLLASLAMLVACGRGQPSSPTRSTETASHKPASQCRPNDLRRLAKAMTLADMRTQRDRVSNGLREACDLPPAVVAFLEATEDGATQAERASARTQELEMLEPLCVGVEVAARKAARYLSAPSFTPALHDYCDFDRLGLVDTQTWEASSPTSLVPFAAKHWLEEQGASSEDASAIARALLVRSYRVWGRPEIEVPTVGGALEPVDPDAVEIEVTLDAVFVDGTLVFELEDGRFPPAVAEGDGLQAIEEAVRTIFGAKERNYQALLAVVADRRVPATTLFSLTTVAENIGPCDLAFVVQSEPLRFGVVRFKRTESRDRFSPELEITANGFRLQSYRRGAPLHVGAKEGALYDFDALASKAEAYAAANAGMRAVSIKLDDGVSTGVFLSSVHELAGRDCATEDSSCWFHQVAVPKRSRVEGYGIGGG